MKGKSNASLELEILTHISELYQILDKSNDYFLLSRFASTPKRREFFQKLYEENLPKSDLILKELWNIEFFKQIKEIVCSKRK